MMSLPPPHMSMRSVADFVLRQDFAAFVRQVFKTVDPAKPFVPNWHVDAICHAVMDFLESDDLHLVINVPPRSLKSIIGSVALPAFLLGRNPSTRIICASYARGLTDDFARATTKVMSSGWYRRLFPNTLIERNPEAGIFTTARGCRRATSVEGTVTGFGADVIIIDDPIKPDDALSDAMREKTNAWLNTTLASRADDKRHSKTILIMQRLHVDDPTAAMLRRPGTRHLNLPAIADRDETFELGYGRTHTWRIGEPLQEEREGLSILERERQRIGDRIFSAQYLQAPVPAEGGMIKWEWFDIYPERPTYQYGDRHIFSWDTAMTDSIAADYSACTEWLVRDKKFYLLDVFRKRLLYPELKRMIMAQSREHPRATILVEDKGSGMSVAQDLIREGIGVVKFKPKDDKVSRASIASDQIQAGNVLRPKEARWLSEFEMECCAFPRGVHDDQVDSMSQAIIWTLEKVRAPGVTLFGSY